MLATRSLIHFAKHSKLAVAPQGRNHGSIYENLEMPDKDILDARTFQRKRQMKAVLTNGG